MLAAGSARAGGPKLQLVVRDEQWHHSGPKYNLASVAGSCRYVSTMESRRGLEEWFRGRGRVLLGYSGGVDSALLAVVGARSLGPDRFLAVLGRSASFPEVQWRQARSIADLFGVPVLEIDTAELANPEYRANSPERCYFCKSELWARLAEVAEASGFDTIIDGTHADDLGEHRPGGRAAAERRIGSPLAELGWTKAMIREEARVLGLPIWDAPAAPCLSSRIRYGLAVTPERLRQVELGEKFLRTLGVRGDLRVRHYDDVARIEVKPDMFLLVDTHWAAIESGFAALGFESVERDPTGYRRGKLLPVAS